MVSIAASLFQAHGMHRSTATISGKVCKGFMSTSGCETSLKAFPHLKMNDDADDSNSASPHEYCTTASPGLSVYKVTQDFYQQLPQAAV